jgi:hypothetical protein
MPWPFVVPSRRGVVAKGYLVLPGPDPGSVCICRTSVRWQPMAGSAPAIIEQ